MIIGTNGYIGSGKDTVGQIIQYLTSECSKSTGTHFRTFEKWKERGQGDNSFQGWYQSEWEIKKFAAKLKQIASLLTGIPVEKFEDQAFKLTNLPIEWARWVTEGDDTYLKAITVREFLQKLGTEAIRNNIHTNAWVNALFADYKPIDDALVYDHLTPEGVKTIYEYPNWIITDVRFINEAQAIKDRGGIIIRVERPETTPHWTTLESLHPSETALNNWEFAYVINNNSTLEDLTGKVKTILKECTLLT